MLDQVFAEGPALPGVGHAFVEADLHHAERLGDQADALQVEILHDGDEAAVLLAEQVFRRHPAFVEIERRLVGAPPAHLAVERRAAEILRIGLDEEQRYAGQPLAAGARRDDEIVARHAAGDEGLAALDDVMVAVLPGPGLQVGDVRTAARFGDAERRSLAAGEDFRQRAHLDLLRGQHGDRGGRDVASADRRADAGRAAFGQFDGTVLAHETVVEAQPAVFLVDAEAEKAERAQLLVDFPRDRPGLVPCVDMGPDLRRHEFRDRLAVGSALGGVEGVLHRRGFR